VKSYTLLLTCVVAGKAVLPVRVPLITALTSRFDTPSTGSLKVRRYVTAVALVRAAAGVWRVKETTVGAVASTVNVLVLLMALTLAPLAWAVAYTE
jgi:hypothetical protein